MRHKLFAMTVAGALSATVAAAPAQARCWACWPGAAVGVGLVGSMIVASDAYAYGGGPSFGYEPYYVVYQPARYATPVYSYAAYSSYGYYRPYAAYSGYYPYRRYWSGASYNPGYVAVRRVYWR